MIEMIDIYRLECKLRMCNNEVELEKLMKIKKEYMSYTNYPYLEKEAKNYRARKYRLNKKTRIMLNKKCYFLTFTLNNENLCDEKELVNRVKSYFKNARLKGYFNIDRGSKNERLHAHAFVQAEYIDQSVKNPLRWKFGTLNFKICSTEHIDSIRLSAYISKLSNHAVKTSVVGKVIHFNYSKSKS